MDWAELLKPAISILEIVLRTSVVYFVVVVGLRIFGKRELGQMTPFDLVLILTLSNSVQNAMVGPDTSLTGGLVSALTLLTINYAFNQLSEKIPFLERALSGEPTLLIYDGNVMWDRLRHESVSFDELQMAAREHQIPDLSQVETAILETDGTISIIPKGSVQPMKTTRRRHKRRTQ